MVSMFCDVIRSVQGGACGRKLGGRGTVGIIANLSHSKDEICVLIHGYPLPVCTTSKMNRQCVSGLSRLFQGCRRPCFLLFMHGIPA